MSADGLTVVLNPAPQRADRIFSAAAFAELHERYRVIEVDSEVDLDAALPDAFAIIGLDPSHCVVFEDSPAGITAGRAAGAGVGVTARATAADGIPVVHDLGGIDWTEDVLTIPSASLLRGVTE